MPSFPVFSNLVLFTSSVICLFTSTYCLIYIHLSSYANATLIWLMLIQKGLFSFPLSYWLFLSLYLQMLLYSYSITACLNFLFHSYFTIPSLRTIPPLFIPYTFTLVPLCFFTPIPQRPVLISYSISILPLFPYVPFLPYPSLSFTLAPLSSPLSPSSYPPVLPAYKQLSVKVWLAGWQHNAEVVGLGST